MTYPPGWSIIPYMLIQRERWPGGFHSKGSALVYPGQIVQADQLVMGLEKAEATSAELHRWQRVQDCHVQQRNQIGLSGISGRVIEITTRGGVVIESRAAIIQGT